jgi:hypothetical protein
MVPNGAKGGFACNVNGNDFMLVKALLRIQYSPLFRLIVWGIFAVFLSGTFAISSWLSFSLFMMGIAEFLRILADRLMSMHAKEDQVPKDTAKVMCLKRTGSLFMFGAFLCFIVSLFIKPY